ncbi:MAG TPA: ATP phosphoribosyltransferase regulatory subunit [Azospira sp.]|nr:ATP phosphoribosyltransferase regulatory subunit [Azospira sp.]HNN08531.1 ATP phosphoribosyltransferase regulatory subunit [Azospira sp.]HNN45994.1 ATP phosphoribosyltransferase regulatory subunit [Azospira sp.]
MNWLLPEYLADALPFEAARIEQQRRSVLDLFRAHGYELVMPPLIEYLDSLLTGSGHDLKLRTFKLVDQVSGRTLGVRADMTPQVARIDAHLLNRQGTTRLCYCDSVLHTMPASISASREPIQIGAELYGHTGHDADVEVIRLMARALDVAGAAPSRIDVGHVGIFRALAEAAGLDVEQLDAALSLLQAKDVPGLQEFCAALPESQRAAFLQLPTLYGGVEVLDRAAVVLPPLPAVTAALATLRRVATALPDLPLSFDLADLRGYHYHNGVVFAAYHPGSASAVALGGRYDGAGAAFGRARAATGFSMDLRLVAQIVGGDEGGGAIVAPAGGDAALSAEVARLRAAGEVVIELLPGENIPEGPRCTRRLVASGGKWTIEQV